MVHLKVYLDHIQHLEIGTEEPLSFKECLPNLKKYTLYRTEIYMKDHWKYKLTSLSPVYFYLSSKKMYLFHGHNNYLKQFKDIDLTNIYGGCMKLFITTTDKVLVTIKINHKIYYKVSDDELDVHKEIHRVVKKDFVLVEKNSEIVSNSLVKLDLRIKIKKKRWFDFFFL